MPLRLAQLLIIDNNDKRERKMLLLNCKIDQLNIGEMNIEFSRIDKNKRNKE